MRTRIHPVLLCLMALVCVLSLAACGGINSSVEPVSDANLAPTSSQISLDEVVDQAKQFPAPPGVPLFEQLRERLVSELEALGKDKIVSTPPRGNGNVVTDLMITNDIAQLDWTYVNIGDYDQNSEVNISDLTPVAVYFGMTPTDSDWINATVADGDNNAEVNLSDITPIAVQFSNSLTAYNVYSSSDIADVPVMPSDPNGPGATTVETINFEDANEPPGFKTFTQVLSAPVDLNWYWVRPTDGMELGGASNAVQFEEPEVLNIPPTADIGATPTEGEYPLLVDFDATMSTDSDGSIVLYEWDWDGATGGLNWEGTGALGTAQHTYDAEGTYDATVRVTDNLGATDTANVSIIVNEPVFTGFKISGDVKRFDTGLPGDPLPDIEVHLINLTGPEYIQNVFSELDGTFEFTNVPGDQQYQVWCDDPMWLWPGPRPVPNTGVLTEDVEFISIGSNGLA